MLGQHAAAPVLSQISAQIEQQVNEVIRQRIEAMTAQMREQLIQGSLIKTGVSIALSAIPVVGQVLGALQKVLAGLTGGKYQVHAEGIIKKAVADVKREQAQSEARIAQRVKVVMQAERAPAVREAIRVAVELGQQAAASPGAGGLGAWSTGDLMRDLRKAGDNISKISTGDMVRAARKWAKDMGEAFSKLGASLRDAGTHFADFIRNYALGKISVIEARKAADRLRRESHIKILEAEKKILADLNKPEFRVYLRQTLAKYLLETEPSRGMLAKLAEAVAENIKAGRVAGSRADLTKKLLIGGGILGVAALIIVALR